jgi:hypothetical protein
MEQMAWKREPTGRALLSRRVWSGSDMRGGWTQKQGGESEKEGGGGGLRAPDAILYTQKALG